MVSIKIEGQTKKGTEVRRVRLEELVRESKSDFQTVVAYVKDSFPKIPHFVLKYKDDEGDLVTVSSEAEFQEAVQVATATKSCLKLCVVEVSPPKPQESSMSKPQESAVSKPQEPVPAEPKISDPIVIEFQLSNKTRSLTLSKSSIKIAVIKESAINVFPELKSSSFNFKYVDDEGDAVTMSEANELEDALQIVKDRLVLIVSVNSDVITSTSSDSIKPVVKEMQKETQDKEKKRWEDVTWDDLNETLERLQELGFTDTALCTRLLERYNYDFDAVVRELTIKK